MFAIHTCPKAGPWGRQRVLLGILATADNITLIRPKQCIFGYGPIHPNPARPNYKCRGMVSNLWVMFRCWKIWITAIYDKRNAVAILHQLYMEMIVGWINILWLLKIPLLSFCPLKISSSLSLFSDLPSMGVVSYDHRLWPYPCHETEHKPKDFVT